MSRNFGKEIYEAAKNNDGMKMSEITKDCVTSYFLKIQNLFNPINGAEHFCLYAAVKTYLSVLEKMDKQSAEIGEALLELFEVEGVVMVVPNTPESSGGEGVMRKTSKRICTIKRALCIAETPSTLFVL